MITLVGEKYLKLENGEIEGEFYLSDNSISQFSIDKKVGWQQWGNSTDKLCISVERIEELTNKFFEGEL